MDDKGKIFLEASIECLNANIGVYMAALNLHGKNPQIEGALKVAQGLLVQAQAMKMVSSIDWKKKEEKNETT